MDMNLPEYLSKSRKKLTLYSNDIYFREAWTDIIRFWGGSENIKNKIWQLTPTIFKPESVLCGNIEKGIGIIDSLSFTPVFVKRIQFDKHKIRASWHYQINKATIERVEAMDSILQAADAVYMLLLTNEPKPKIPGIVHFSRIKGPANPLDRKPDHLRYKIGGVEDNLINFIHSVDEPADVIREMGVLFTKAERLEVLEHVDAKIDISTELPEFISEALDSNPRNNLNLFESLENVKKEITSKRRTLLPKIYDALMLDIQLLEKNNKGIWPNLFKKLLEAGIIVDRQDAITISCLTTVMHLDGSNAILSSNLTERWMRT